MKLEEVNSDSDDDLPPLEDNSKHLRDIQGSKTIDTAAVKKGFLDQPTTKPVKAKDGTNLTELKGKKNTPGGTKSIPEFLKVEQEEAPKLTQAQVKEKLVDAMKPTPEMVKDVSANPLLMEGFDDPEVMAAVSEIAEDPKKMEKYKDNKKVQRFYAAMGNIMGSKFEKLAVEQEKDPAFQAAKARRDAEMRAQHEMVHHQAKSPPGVILNPGGVAPPALREVTPVDNHADSDSDEDMAEIARAMQSNPFARKKPGAGLPPNTKAAPAKAAAKTHASNAVAPPGVGTRHASSCIAERLQKDLLAEKEKGAEQKTPANCPGIVMLPSANKEIGLREIKTTIVQKGTSQAELETQATSKQETQETVSSQVVQNKTLPPQPLKVSSSFSMYDELSELD
ncbi:hypothetical protein CYMTET_10408 [Cymbomonas tetramitiformis]|uniref:STI1 domain-containing protein n=1 Tax=Cymbomonas tetramitiformis TaxID=36881 RepID=A0AAE0GPU0_9CHLO|nr:hypothetical protein CYMTET_10408 [Cymbomonas tetramitiformis]